MDVYYPYLSKTLTVGKRTHLEVISWAKLANFQIKLKADCGKMLYNMSRSVTTFEQWLNGCQPESVTKCITVLSHWHTCPPKQHRMALKVKIHVTLDLLFHHVHSVILFCTIQQNVTDLLQLFDSQIMDWWFLLIAHHK